MQALERVEGVVVGEMREGERVGVGGARRFDARSPASPLPSSPQALLRSETFYAMQGSKRRELSEIVGDLTQSARLSTSSAFHRLRQDRLRRRLLRLLKGPGLSRIAREYNESHEIKYDERLAPAFRVEARRARKQSERTEVGGSLGLVVEDLLDLLHNLGGELRDDVESLEVVDD